MRTGVLAAGLAEVPRSPGRRVNPLLGDWLAGQTYYWVIDQAEFSTDVLFADKKGLASLRPALYEHAVVFWRGTGDDVFGT